MATLEEWLADPEGGPLLREEVGTDDDGRPDGILGNEELLPVIGNMPISTLAAFPAWGWTTTWWAACCNAYERARRCHRRHAHPRAERAQPQLARLLAAANASTQAEGRWHAQQVTAAAARHERPLVGPPADRAQQRAADLPAAAPRRRGVAIERDYGMKPNDAEVVIAGGCLLHDLGMSIHRVDHESFSLFLAADLLDDLLADVYEEPERTIVVARSCTRSSATARAAGR
jgi:hypothetical protein